MKKKMFISIMKSEEWKVLSIVLFTCSLQKIHHKTVRQHAYARKTKEELIQHQEKSVKPVLNAWQHIYFVNKSKQKIKFEIIFDQ